MSSSIQFRHFEVEVDEAGAPIVLGRGAMGVTYRAFDTNLRRQVALKVIAPSLVADGVSRQRFLREARTAASLRHPNVATVLFLGEAEGDVFYAMEYVEGRTLEAELKARGPLPAREVAQIAIAVTKALTSAHRSGLIHRDIKPSNIMLTQHEGETDVKLIDFGLAKLSGGEFTGETLAAASAAGFQGTPHFASPEQINNEETDIRADMYSLGVTVFTALTGRAPFEGTLAQVLSKHLAQPPPLDTLPADAAPLKSVLAKVLEKDPSARYQTPSELRDDLEIALKLLPEIDEFATIGFVGGFDKKPGEVFASRYRLDGRKALLAHVTIHCAERLDGGPPAGLIFFDLDSWNSSREVWKSRAAILQGLTSPGLISLIGIEADPHSPAMVTEWIEGPTLIDLIKNRRSLPAIDAAPVLQKIAAGLDALHAAQVELPPLSLGDVVISPPEVLLNPVSQVKGLRAAFLGAWPGPDDAGVGDVTVVADGRRASGESPVSLIARLAYEILGGLRLEGAFRWTPLAALSAQANDLLRGALEGKAEAASAQDFIKKLLAQEMLKSGVRPALQSALISTGGRGPVPAGPPPLPPLPAKRKPLLTVFLALAAVAIVGVSLLGVAAYFLTRAAKPTIAQEPTTPATDFPSSTTEPAVEPTPEPTPTPPEDPVVAILRLADAAKLKDDFSGALLQYAEAASLAQDPSAPLGQMEMISAMMRSNAFKMSENRFVALRPALERAASMGVVSAQMVLAENLRATDPVTSLQWFSKAGEKGQTEAMTQAGLMLASGVGTGSPDFAAAAGWFARGAALGDTDASVAMADCLLNGKGVPVDKVKAVEYLRSAAAFNHPMAISLLGILTRQGVPGVIEPNMTEAFRLFSQATDMGSVEAQANLGVMYVNGWGTAKDPAKAVSLWKEGAELGDPVSMLFFAQALSEGRGTAKDKASATQWFVSAAKKGNGPAREWCKKNNIPW